MFEQWNKKFQGNFRYFKEQDYDKGVFDLLGQLTKAPQPSRQDFLNHIQKMSKLHSKHINIVCEYNGKIVAFGSIIITPTLHGKVGKIQNIVTCKSVRGKGMGKMVIEILKDQGWMEQCKRITLFCQDKNVAFYRKLGFNLQGQIYACYNQ